MKEHLMKNKIRFILFIYFDNTIWFWFGVKGPCALDSIENMMHDNEYNKMINKTPI